jgi:hypothetical protein
MAEEAVADNNNNLATAVKTTMIVASDLDVLLMLVRIQN